MNIIDILMSTSEFTESLGKAAFETEEYRAASDELSKELNKLSRKQRLKLDDLTTRVETIATANAFREGLRSGIELVVSSSKKDKLPEDKGPVSTGGVWGNVP